MKKGYTHILYTLLLALAVLPVFAQVKTTKVSGKVLDGKNGAPLVGATVSVSGENSFSASARTDVEGQFFFSLPDGKKYNITISNIGFADNTQSVATGSKDLAPLQFLMEKAGKELGVVVVSSSARREATASLYNAQKNASAISDGISAEMIRKSPDRNTGEVLKRVSGASIQDNKFVIIRGLSERYNVSLLNNAVLPSTEADKKAFAFDILPSLVDNIVINKSASPDLPGDFAGGAIRIFTKDYPNRPISELNLSIGYNTLTTGKNFYKGYPNGSLDQLGFLDNSRLIPGPFYRHRNGFISQSDDFKIATTKLFSNTFGSNPAIKSLPNISLSYTGGNTSIYKNGNKLGYVYNLGYSTGRAVGDRGRSEFDVVKRNVYEYNTNNYDEKNNITALLNLTYSYRKSKLSFKNLFNNSFVKTLGLRSGANYENGEGQSFLIKSSNTEVNQNGLLNSVLEGLHQLNNSLSIDWNASYGYTYKNQPDQKILSYRTPENGGDYYLKLSNENSPEIRNAGRVYSFLGESIYGASVNATKRFDLFGHSQKLKVGTMNYYRNRNVEVDALGYASLNFTGVTIRETKETSFGTLFSPGNIDNYRLTIANIETNSANYEGTALLNAGYLMLDNQFNDNLKLTWGVVGEIQSATHFQRKGRQKLRQYRHPALPVADLCRQQQYQPAPGRIANR
ncbi:MAG: TonB-dependent receptor [Flavihumibacter sp.]